MTILMIFSICIVFILALSGSLKRKARNSRGNIINAQWLDTTEKFKLITRWGAQL